MGNPITFTPKNVPVYSAGFLSEDEQKAYEDAVKKFKNKRARQVLNVPIKGSNLFKVLLLNQIGIRTATMAELDQIVQADKNFLIGKCEDAPSVVLRSNGDSNINNDYLAKSLAKSIKVKRFSGMPFVISGMELFEDNNSAYGLNFKAGKTFDFFKAPELMRNCQFKIMNEKGIPVEDEMGNRTSYTRQDGLSRFFLNMYMDVRSSYRNLIESDESRLVVVVKALEASSQK